MVLLIWPVSLLYCNKYPFRFSAEVWPRFFCPGINSYIIWTKSPCSMTVILLMDSASFSAHAGRAFGWSQVCSLPMQRMLPRLQGPATYLTACQETCYPGLSYNKMTWDAGQPPVCLSQAVVMVLTWGRLCTKPFPASLRYSFSSVMLIEKKFCLC